METIRTEVVVKTVMNYSCGIQIELFHNDWFALQMSRLYRHPKFQRAVIGFWSGSRKPTGIFVTVYKVIKALLMRK